MQMQQKTINGKPITCIQKFSNFSGGKDILIWNLDESFIQLDQNQTKQYQQYCNQHQTKNPFAEQKINSEIIREVIKEDKPKNLSKEQKKIEKKILQGDDKESVVTDASVSYGYQISSRNYSEDCNQCKLKDWEIQTTKKRIQQLEYQNQYKQSKLRAQRQQNDSKQKEFFNEILTLKNKIQSLENHIQKSISFSKKSNNNSICLQEALDSSFNVNKSRKSFKKKSQRSMVLEHNPETKTKDRNQSIIFLSSITGEQKQKYSLKVPASQIYGTSRINESKERNQLLQHSRSEANIYTNAGSSDLYLQDSGSFTQLLK